MLKKQMIALLAAAMLLAGFTSVFAAGGPSQSVVSQEISYPAGAENPGKATVYRYTPDDFKFRGNSTPIIFVLSSSAYTEETASAALNSYGFAEMAQEESGHVVFVSPLNGSTWTEDDYAVMQALGNNTVDDYRYALEQTDTYKSGVRTDGKFYSSRSRFYVFAEGSAAEFARTYLNSPDTSYPNTDWGRTYDGFGAGFGYAQSGSFDKTENLKTWNTIKKQNRILLNDKTYLAPYDVYSEMGLTRTIETFTTKNLETNVTFEYYMYVPQTVDLSSHTEQYPLVLGFHGNNMHPEAYMQLARWPAEAAKQGFVTVAPNANPSDAAVAEFIDYMVAERAIDPTRVYSAGYSMGGMKSWSLGFNYTGLFAAISPVEGIPGMGKDFNYTAPSMKLPTFFIAGQEEFYNLFPVIKNGPDIGKQNDPSVKLINLLSQANGFPYANKYDEEIGGFWGMEFDRSYVQSSTPVMADGRGAWNVHELKSDDDIVYTVMSDVTDMGHSVFPPTAEHVWRFFRQFARQADGEITVNRVTEQEVAYPAGAQGQRQGTVYRYTPNGFKFHGNNTPLIFVLGNYDQESANAALMSNGLDLIADRENAHVLFVSPQSGSTWTADDYAFLQALGANTEDSYRFTEERAGLYNGGVSSKGVFYSSRTRFYVFADGASASDFAGQYLNNNTATTPNTAWGKEYDGFGAGFYLAKDGLAKEAVAQQWKKISRTNRIILDNKTYLAPYDYYEEDLGMTRTIEYFTTSTGKMFEYYLYVPKNVDLNSTTAKYPLVFGFHGSGNHPEVYAQLTRWPAEAAKQGFVVVAPNNNPDDDAVIELMDYMIDQKAIDPTRIYSSGYSMGAGKTWSLGRNHGTRFAGIAPAETSGGMGEVSYKLPAFVILGQQEFRNMFPVQTVGDNIGEQNDVMVNTINLLSKANDFDYANKYDKTIGGFWGMEFYKSYVQSSTPVTADGRGTWNIHEIKSKDGIVYTVLSDVTDMGHSMFPPTAEHVWRFFRQFARQADGEITVNRVTEQKVAYPAGAQSQQQGTIYRYTPNNFKFYGNNTPLIFVLGSYNKESANAALLELGLDAIAEKENAHVIFVSPQNGSTWTADDYAFMQALGANTEDTYRFSEERAGLYNGGVTAKGLFYSSRTRFYVFADGKPAADFADQYLNSETAITPNTAWGKQYDGFGAGFYLAEDGLAKEAVTQQWKTMSRTNRIILDNKTYLAPYDYYEKDLGMTRSIEHFTSSKGKMFEYYLYVPQNVNLSSTTAKYPLVFGFHGSGNHPEAYVQLTRWPHEASKQGFVVVAPNNNPDDDAIVEFIDYMVKNRAVDQNRVYSAGYSMGAMKSWSLGFNYPGRFAAISPAEGIPGMGRDFNYAAPSVKLPVFFIAGQTEFYNLFPVIKNGENAGKQNDPAVKLINLLAQANGFSYGNKYDTDIGGFWGMAFDKSYVQSSTPVMDDGRGTWTINELKSSDGKVYTILSDVSEMGHSMFPLTAEVVWPFFKQFDRAPSTPGGGGTTTPSKPQQPTTPGTDTVKDVKTMTDPVTGTVTETKVYESGKTVETVRKTDGEVGIKVLSSKGELVVNVTIPSKAEQVTFSDVPASHWADASIGYTAGIGLFKGNDHGAFEPDVLMTRGMFVTVLHRLSGEIESGDGLSFADVNNRDYFKQAVLWAAEHEIVKGYSASTFAPGDSVSREMLAAILYRYAMLLGLDTSSGDLSSFGDGETVSGWAAPAMGWAVKHGLINGMPGNLLAPQGTASRAEVSAIVYRLSNLIQK